MKCNSIIEKTNASALPQYYDCPNKAKYRVTFLRGTTGKVSEQNICGKHLVSLKKNIERMFKRTGFDSDLKIYELK